MPKVNVYLPDDLADAVRDSGLPVSTICQRALEQAVRRMTTIREAVLSDLDRDRLATRLPSFTARLVTVLTLAADRAKEAGAATLTTGDLLAGLIAERDNLALQVLLAMDIAPESLTAPSTPEPGRAADGLRFSTPAAVALELAVTEAVGFGHNYVGCEHLLIALAGEPDGAAGEMLRSRGADAKATRRAVAAAVAGYSHLRTANAGKADAAGALLKAVRAEIAPLIERIERLEGRTN
nr:Clp protease N-terminal domain-containing protein [uncultured Actinoplanes sp.]